MCSSMHMLRISHSLSLSSQTKSMVYYSNNRNFGFTQSLRFYSIPNVLFFFNFYCGAGKLPLLCRGYNSLIDCRTHCCFQDYVLEDTSTDPYTKDSFSLDFHMQQISYSLINPHTLILWVDKWPRACRLILINLLESELNLF